MSSKEGRKGKSEDIRREKERGAGRRGRVWLRERLGESSR